VSLAGPATLRYFLTPGSPLGELQIYLCGYSDGGVSYSAYWPHQALFCRICGALWARGILTYDFDYQPRFPEAWTLVARRCRECGDGRLLCDLPLEGASPGLLQRELEVLLTLYDKEIA